MISELQKSPYNDKKPMRSSSAVSIAPPTYRIFHSNSGRRKPNSNNIMMIWRNENKFDEQQQQNEHYPAWHGVLTALTWFTLSSVLLWAIVLPSATEWWVMTTTSGELPEATVTASTTPVLLRSSSPLLLPNTTRGSLLPGGYRSQAEMDARRDRFPSVTERVKVYMSNWYTPPCAMTMTTTESDTEYSFIQYNYLSDPTGKPPLLVLQELTVPEDAMSIDNEDDDNDDDDVYNKPRKYSHSGNNRTFLLDSTASVKGARLFYLHADEIRRCDLSPCYDTLNFLFPSLHRIDMSHSRSSISRHLLSFPKSFPGNALDSVSGNTNAVVPIVLQFGDLEVSRAFVTNTLRNETYPVIPSFKKFRWSLERSKLELLTSGECAPPTHDRMLPLTPTGERRLQPIISKLTYKRHFGMLDEIPQHDIPWNAKRNAAIWRGALTGMKRNGFRVVRNAMMQTKTEMCLQMQRCKLVFNHANSTLVNASLVGVSTFHSHNMLDGPVVPEVLEGVRLYGPRVSYADMLQYKAIIMLEGNDISSGLKWALYSNSVVMTQPSTYTSWAMEELLEPWVHYIPLADDLSDVEEKMQWVLDNDEEAQQIAHRGKLWISDLIYHPDAVIDEDAIFDETFRRYKQHFVHSPKLLTERLVFQG